ncbi:hypothetical protein TPHA_0O00960 [Tetrapisispora phaffii CBS 4417]|uniref:Uncharacterized protein n=1 Tax=Tetrapisispora phaffii (strain ATCC 24235 / CBS 4417 / NBRC 1672 / NRRL Y-8282 / UCD 70-5) TaxID=1071381 RepID=G8C1N7_TETPH|nr:hypothetical protein TPHA_0O00960 [Tetrapisispora phaffii CBS 4417]CCE66065.1 hypothetical protein TPHA_0O00960 [Tetrapisispora phaffii CBS 4417]
MGSRDFSVLYYVSIYHMPCVISFSYFVFCFRFWRRLDVLGSVQKNARTYYQLYYPASSFPPPSLEPLPSLNNTRTRNCVYENTNETESMTTRTTGSGSHTPAEKTRNKNNKQRRANLKRKSSVRQGISPRKTIVLLKWSVLGSLDLGCKRGQ